ncbi:hypothetical protein GCM10010404_82180 [Nonomuraea africana]|uniref:Uncharacterized protein n=1 Tax=Nonomuraea africana TaxID=46171 RepID=A0ABR9KX13_9ACTN|nr:hypothetical protein [Nonomuraea africana]MBE1566545.1 hypothetical protein [Nonomuraea africana]
MIGAELVEAGLRVFVVAALPLMAVAYLAFLVGSRVGRREGDRERRRLAQRLDTFTTILRPVAVAARTGKRGCRLSPRDIAVLALLVDEPGEDGDLLAELEAMFHRIGPPD